MSLATAIPMTATIPAADGGPPVWPITVAMFTDMAYAGVIPEKERVFLWKGRLARRMTINRPHSLSLTRSSDPLRGVIPAAYHIETEQPMALRLEPSVPQPDLMILRGRCEDYPRDFPTSADVPLIAEVSDSSLAEDRKLAFTYAAEGIPVYWLINIPGRRLEVYSEPAEGAYTRCTPHGPEEEAAVILDGHEVGRVRVADLLP